MFCFRLIMFGSALLLGCSDAPAPEAPLPESPLAESRPAFAGSEACATCHSAQYADWQNSHHDLAMQIANPDTVLGDFSDTTFDYFDTESRFLRKDGAFVVRTENADSEMEDFRVTHTFGIHP